MNKKIKSKKGKHSYHFEDDVFSVAPLSRVYSSSVQIGNFILDLDKNNKIVGVELLNASKLFNVPKVFLQSILKGEVTIAVEGDRIRIEMSLESEVRNGHKLSNLSVERVKPSYLDDSKMTLAVA